MTSSSTPLDAIAVALQVAAAIEAAGGAYFVGGSLASSLQGEPRATNDIDIVFELPIGRISALASALGPSFEVDQDMVRDALLHGRSCNVFYLPSVMKVDLFAVGSTAGLGISGELGQTAWNHGSAGPCSCRKRDLMLRKVRSGGDPWHCKFLQGRALR